MWNRIFFQTFLPKRHQNVLLISFDIIFLHLGRMIKKLLVVKVISKPGLN
jgi:hypothetical protein